MFEFQALQNATPKRRVNPALAEMPARHVLLMPFDRTRQSFTLRLQHGLFFVLLITLSCTSTITNFREDTSIALYEIYIESNPSKGRLFSIGFKRDDTFICRKQTYKPDINEAFGGGLMERTENGLILRNTDCKIEPSFSVVSCRLNKKSGFGRLYNLLCTDDKGLKLDYWFMQK